MLGGSAPTYLRSPHIGKLPTKRMKEREELPSKLGDHERLFETLGIQQGSFDDLDQDFVIPFVRILCVKDLRQLPSGISFDWIGSLARRQVLPACPRGLLGIAGHPFAYLT
jgi:hypothetical protein